MSKLKKLLITSSVSGLAVFGGLLGCDGSNTGGGFSESRGTTFVADETNTGTLSVSLNSSRVGVSGTTGFAAKVMNASGMGVSGIQITCDTERGLALVDPTSGRFITNANGEVSGIVGCASPGSFIMGCRLASGAETRVFEQVVCTGDVPDSFEGFPGAGGGSLGNGGGVVAPDAGGPGGGDFQGQIRIGAIIVRDIFGDEDGVPQIDTAPDVCDAGTPDDPSDDFVETWGDDEVILSVTNDTDRQITVTGIEYTVKGGRSDGSDARSPFIRVVGDIQPRAEDVLLEATIFDATTDAVKTYADAATPIPYVLGPRNVRFTVFGITNLDEAVQFSASTNFNFDRYDNCGQS